MADLIIYNANPCECRVGDCTVRAISKATGRSWEVTYIKLCIEGLCMCDMPSANRVWGSYLRRCGFKRRTIGEDADYTVDDFCNEHPTGVYVLALQSHVVCVQDGKLYDTWDSRNEIPLYVWIKEEDD